MTASRVRFDDEAEAEYRAAGRWYEERRPRLGVEFFDAVDATIRRILEFPRSGVAVPGVARTFPVRRLPVMHFPFHVVYLELPDAFRVLAVAHDRRRPGYWKSRLK